ncbi:RICIN domain-containing protein [Streptomyces sp. NPDC059398]|uniref:RICIN domain-containing protein n=1 Tax=Streptomyces sp. NPDC059398 TaxID=3346820 RepID=UPI0036965401
MKTISKIGITTGVATLALTAFGPASPAQAWGSVHLVNKATGKCLQFNGLDKKVTLAACKNTNKQRWANMGSKLATIVNPYGGDCLAHSGKNKPAYGRGCSKAQVMMFSSLKINSSTSIGSAGCGYFKEVSGKVMCGVRPSNRSQSTWVVKS